MAVAENDAAQDDLLRGFNNYGFGKVIYGLVHFCICNFVVIGISW